VNRVFLSGKIRKKPEVAYTPKGRKVVTFPLWVDEGAFSVEVIGAGEAFPGKLDGAAGSGVLVAGELVRTRLKSRDVLRVKASKILWMEE
jgi:primosomal replication protein N